MAGRRLDPPGDDLLPGAATALDASGATPVEPPPDEGPGPAIEPRDYPLAAPPRRRGRPPGSKNRPKPAPVEAAIRPAGQIPAAGESATDLPLATPPAAPPRRRGRPPGSKNRPKPPPSAAAVVAAPAVSPPGPGPGAVEAPAASPAAPRRRGRPPGRTGTPRRPTATPSARRDRLTIEQIVAVESPREPRLSPDGRRVAYTQEAAGARQVFLLGLRTGQVRQLTASEKNVTDPQWAPDGERLAFVRETAIWMVGADGSRPTLVTDHPAGNKAPRWSPDGRRIAFISRRRGWGQAWVVDAPLPRRGRRPAHETAAEPRAVSPVGWDVEEISWSPDGTQLAVLAQRDPDLRTFQVTLVEVATGAERRIAGDGAWETAATWLPDGQGLLLVSDRDGWFQVVRIATDGGGRTVLTEGSVEHGDYGAGFGSWPLASPDGSRFVHALISDGRQDLVVAPLPAGPGRAAIPRRPGRPPKARPVTPAWGPRSIVPFPGVWLAVAWLPDGSGLLAVGESEREPEDLWILPAPGPDGTPAADRPRRLTTSRPAILPAAGFVESERHVIRARDGRAIPLTLWRPPQATGRRGGKAVPTIVHAHGGPTSQVYRDWQPLRQLLVQEGFAFLSVDFRGSTGYGREHRWANVDEWGHADLHDVIDAARWAADQAWSNGRLGMYGGSYGGYLTLCALVEEPAMWAAGVDLFGDSEIAESFRHGDRPGRIDLQRMMGLPDDPARAPLYRRGSPLYRAERIEAPLLILHGRRDKRVVPLMTEKMVEALEVEGKFHEVHWYDDEGHGYERRENLRDALGRIVAWLKRYLAGEPPPADR